MTAFYQLDLGRLPAELFAKSVPAASWLDRCTTAGIKGFAQGTLGNTIPLPLFPYQLERMLGITLYLFFQLGAPIDINFDYTWFIGCSNRRFVYWNAIFLCWFCGCIWACTLCIMASPLLVPRLDI